MRRLAAVTLPALALLALYAPQAGHGFIKDDFPWIAGSRVASPADLATLFTTARGFYRPLVGLTFAADSWLFGLAPLGYGLTNLALLLGCAVALAALARALTLPWGAAAAAALLWAWNPHGINMAVLWISGRTALLLTLFALLAAHAFLRGCRALACLWCLLALLSKEEAVALPFVLAGWAALWPAERPLSPRRGVTVWPLLIPLAAYLILRSRTAADVPSTAPAFYRFSFDPGLLARNVVEYADRAGSVFAVATLVAALLLVRRPRLGARETRIAGLGVAWALGGYALTVLLPVRSSLYACLPSAGLALAAAAVLAQLWEEATQAPRRRLLMVAAVLPLALVPIYRGRNARWVAPADLSARVVPELARAARGFEGVLVVNDPGDPARKDSLASTFGTLLEDAVRLTSDNPRVRVWVVPPPPYTDLAGLGPPQPGEAVKTFTLEQGRLAPKP